MPRRRKQAVLTDFLDDAVDTFLDRAVDRAATAFDELRSKAFEEQRSHLPDEYLDGTFQCAGCKKEFGIEDMEQVHPTNGWGTCRGCYSFMFKAGVEKAKSFAKRAARQGAKKAKASGRARQQQQSGFRPPPPPSGPPPWEVLGVDQDASVDQIKKAYRKMAGMYHPDRVAPGAPSSERERATQMFHAVQRAYDVMMKVRAAPQ